jgi:hypothetical protein
LKPANFQKTSPREWLARGKLTSGIQSHEDPFVNTMQVTGFRYQYPSRHEQTGLKQREALRKETVS